MATAAETSLRLDVSDLKNRLRSGEPVTILDVRAPQAYDASDEKISGAIRVAPDQFDIASKWPHDRLTVTYCT